MGNYCCAESQIDNKNSTPIPSQATSNYNSKEAELSGSHAGNLEESVSGSVDEPIVVGGEILPTPDLREFGFAELKSATKGFKADSVLGEGGFGKVYKGWIDEKSSSKGGGELVVAVKKLNSESMQGFDEWQSEVNFLGRLSHPNLVRLLGFCWEDKELLLVYEFMQKGSLENHLFRRGAAVQPLSWNLRLKIVLGAARGLAFLHSSEKQIIYRDFKASNILLDGNYNAKLSDFGLAKNGPTGDASHVTTRVMGTYGYAAPEYVATGHLYLKSDVYGFGVVLLEMLTGQRALDTKRPNGQHNLVEWLKPSLSDRRKLMRIMDPRLDNQFPAKAAVQAAQLTIKCLGSEPRIRPSMTEVVESLERIKAIKRKIKETRPNSRPTTGNFYTQQPQDYPSFRVLSVGPIPNHIAFIMDGNRRYARSKNLKEGAGHRVGFLALLSILKYCYELKIKYATVYAFSIDNFRRRPTEVQYVMNLLEEKAMELLEEESTLNNYGVRVCFVGNLSLLNESARIAAEKAMAATAGNDNVVLSICVAYTSTDEMVHAVQEACNEKRSAFQELNSFEKTGSEIVEVDKKEVEYDPTIKLTDIERHMYLAGIPDPDIVIRTSGETRLSNFLLWQTAHSYLDSPPVLWPEITMWTLVWVILSFQRFQPYLDRKKKMA